MNPVLWFHGDCLDAKSPLFRNYPHSPAIFVWDDAYLQQAGFSLKRIMFIYECLLALPVTIRRGDLARVVGQFAHEQNRYQIATMHSPSPGFARISRRLTTMGFSLELHHSDPFVTLPQDIDLKRFSRYWRKAQKELAVETR